MREQKICAVGSGRKKKFMWEEVGNRAFFEIEVGRGGNSHLRGDVERGADWVGRRRFDDRNRVLSSYAGNNGEGGGTSADPPLRKVIHNFIHSLRRCGSFLVLKEGAQGMRTGFNFWCAKGAQRFLEGLARER